ncbi:hypothetical protein ACFC09_07965 [Streptomyces sp. NPDC056161]|uniref:hypothetical protein n=1 Tax=Streptomyces sp. NPDC056161 TaxID=3345732 RepID=UPI0035E2C4A2
MNRDEETGEPVMKGGHDPGGEPVDLDKSASAGEASAPIHFAVVVSGDGSAAINGEPVPTADGESADTAILDALHRHAQDRGTTVTAAISDPSAGYVAYVEVTPDGSSRLLEQHEEPHPEPDQPSGHTVAPPAPSAPDVDPAAPEYGHADADAEGDGYAEGDAEGEEYRGEEEHEDAEDDEYEGEYEGQYAGAYDASASAEGEDEDEDEDDEYAQAAHAGPGPGPDEHAEGGLADDAYGLLGDDDPRADASGYEQAEDGADDPDYFAGLYKPNDPAHQSDLDLDPDDLNDPSDPHGPGDLGDGFRRENEHGDEYEYENENENNENENNEYGDNEEYRGEYGDKDQYENDQYENDQYGDKDEYEDEAAYALPEPTGSPFEPRVTIPTPGAVRDLDPEPDPEPESELRSEAESGPKFRRSGNTRQSDDEYRPPGLLNRPLVVGPVALIVAALVIVPLVILGSGGSGGGNQKQTASSNDESYSPTPGGTPTATASPFMFTPAPTPPATATATPTKPKAKSTPKTAPGPGTVTVTAHAPRVTKTVIAAPPQDTAADAVKRLARNDPSGRHICYRAYVGSGWQKPVCDGTMAGTTGRNLAIKALNISTYGVSGSAANAFLHDPKSTNGQGHWQPNWTAVTGNGKDFYIGSGKKSAPYMTGFAINVGSGQVCQAVHLRGGNWGDQYCKNARPDYNFGGTLDNNVWLEAVKFTV